MPLTRALACLRALAVAGCAQRRDWVQGILVTVDVTGRWAGSWERGSLAGELDMALRQTGPKTMGDVKLTGVVPGTYGHRV